MPVPTLDIKGKGAAAFAEAFVGRYKKIKEEQQTIRVRKFEHEQETKLFKARQKQQLEMHEEEIDLQEAQIEEQKRARVATEERLAGAEEFKQDFARFKTMEGQISSLINLREASRERKDDVEFERIQGLIKAAEPDYLRLGKELKLFTIPDIDRPLVEVPEIEVEREPRDLLPKAMGFARVAGLPLRPFRAGIMRIFDVVDPVKWREEIEKLTKGMEGERVFKRLWGEEVKPIRTRGRPADANEDPIDIR